jgi:ribA/ribD-fused uncharacterized protein
MSAEEFHLFYNGPFSQWEPAPFTILGIRYNCAEQFMMAEKARLFADEAALAKIMKAKHPADQKRTGRNVKGFDNNRWQLNAKVIVYRGTVATFTQNQQLGSVLQATGSKTRVEASPTDKIWGICLAEDDPRALERSQWQGTNWLGEILTLVRDELRPSS